MEQAAPRDSFARVVGARLKTYRWEVLFGGLVFGYLASLLAMPIVYDTMHLEDTLLIANGGWRVFQGLTPAVDYGHFYGGLADQFVALSYGLFGVDVRSLEYAVLLEYGAVLLLTGAMVVGRMHRLGIGAVVVVLTTCCLTRAPLEEWTSLTRLASAHSFSYNRLGLAFGLAAFVPALVPASARRFEVFGAAAAGLALALACLAQSSFVALVPAAALAIGLQRRWPALGACAAAFVVGFLILDPTAQRFLGSMRYAAASALPDQTEAVGGLVFKTIRTTFTHLLAIGATLTGLGLAAAQPGVGRWGRPLGALGLLAAATVVTLTMGPFGLIGHQLIPVCAVILLVAWEWARRSDHPHRFTHQVLALGLVFTFTLPHFINALLVTAAGFSNRSEVLIDEGPMAGYLQRHTRFVAEAAARSDGGPVSRDAIIAAAAADIEATGRVSRPAEYPAFVDGLAALSRFEGIRDLVVIGDNLYNYEFALGSRPTMGYPIYPRRTSPEITGGDDLPAEVDLALVLRHGAGRFGAILQARMGNAFELCEVTPIWAIYARRSSNIDGCTF